MSGGGTVDWEEPRPGPETSLAFNARIDADGVAKGQLERNYLITGEQEVHGRIDCLYVSGNQAKFSGVITLSAAYPDWVGRPFFMGVEDNGEGVNAPADRLGALFMGEEGTSFDCQSVQPNIIWTLDTGNIEVDP